MSRQVEYVLLVTFCSWLLAGCGSRVQVTVKVVDDDNLAVPDAKVVVMGYNTQAEGKTDKAGFFPARLRNVTGQLDFVVRKEGFYTIGWVSYYFTGQTNGRWRPWNPTVELQLRRHGKPVPMVVKQIEGKMPVFGQSIGFDLVVGDWVRPYGNGRISDFLLLAERWMRESNRVAGRLKLSFSNPDDGLCRVRLPSRNDYGMRLPGIAPGSGYMNEWEWRLRPEMDQDPLNPYADLNFDQDSNYYFRVRSQRSNNGDLRSAMYGKIYYGVQFGVWENRPDFSLKLLYYLNPDGTRNTEFDMRSNLCPNPGDAGGKP
jgi:hypothetical protein